MIIFAADSSSSAGSAAIYCDGVILAESFCNVGLTHSETFMILCDDVFKLADKTPSEVDYFAISTGPGSFTGLRIGMGAVKGMAFATSKPCVAVPTLEALAYGVLPSERVVVPVLDARQKRVYATAYSTCPGLSQIFDDCVLNFDELYKKLENHRVVFVGDAANMCYNILANKLDCALPAASNILTRASNVAIAAADRIEKKLICSSAELAPVYIQLPQAQRELLAKMNGEIN